VPCVLLDVLHVCFFYKNTCVRVYFVLLYGLYVYVYALCVEVFYVYVFLVLLYVLYVYVLFVRYLYKYLMCCYMCSVHFF